MAQASDPNPVRKLFELHRLDTIAALMHDCLLIPEGLLDVELLHILAMAVDAHQQWEAGSDSHFLAHVGVVRTTDGQVMATYQRLRDLHPRIICLLDGDAAGDSYLASLAGEPAPPTRALRWSNGWTIEDVFGWVLDAEPAVLETIDGILPVPVKTTDLVARLKSKDRTAGGLKQDRVAYEAIGQAIAGSTTARGRALVLLNAVASECLGEDTSLFCDHGELETLLVRVFNP